VEHAKLATGTRHQSPIGRSASPGKPDERVARSAGQKALRKNTEPSKAKPPLPLQKKMGSKPKANQLVCRYCASADLAPSFIKRRDRRCRQCFSKRYGSAARANKAQVK
jgi:hypothetical protein